MSESESRKVELQTLQADQEAYGSDGEPVGQVAKITVDIDSDEPYLEVTGHFRTLYIPESAIEYAVLGKPIRLNVPGDEARTRFTRRPNII